MNKALTIGGSDPSGGAGIQADLKTFAALGVYGTSVITSVTAQNTVGIQGMADLHSRFISLQIESVFSDIKLDSIKIGMVPNNEIIETVSKALKKQDAKNIVLDPVMSSKGGIPLLNPGAKYNLVKKLFPLALLVTPNIPEASSLSKVSIKSYNDIKEAAKIIHRAGAKNVLIKGGHFRGKAVDTLYNGNIFKTFEAKRIPNKHVHGTGCTLASAIAAELAKGSSLVRAIQKAKVFITNSILHSIEIGKGSSTINHFLDFYRDSIKHKMLREMESALDILIKGEIGCLIPEVQSNIGCGLENVITNDDIITFPDRLIKKGHDIIAISRPTFGNTSHIASIILTVMKHDPIKRAAMNIKYSPEIITACKKANLSISSFSRNFEPKQIKEKEGSTLEWGTAQAIKKFGSVPDIIYDTGGIGKEPMVRVLDVDPVSVANKVLQIKDRYLKIHKA